MSFRHMTHLLTQEFINDTKIKGNSTFILKRDRLCCKQVPSRTKEEFIL